MDHTCDFDQMLNMIPMPAFTVRDSLLDCCNAQARQLLLEPGMALKALLTTGKEEYAAFDSGSLYLDITVHNTLWGATVTKVGDVDLFRLEQGGVSPELKAMSLLSSQLRAPMSSLVLTAKRGSDKPDGELLRDLDRVNRILNNVSNAYRFLLDSGVRQQDRHIRGILEEVLQECRELLAQANIGLEYRLSEKDIITTLDSQLFRQAVYNLLNNAAKHTEPGGSILVELTQAGKHLRLSVTNRGRAIREEVAANLFSRYTRHPNVEDGLYGLGLGLTIVKTMATAHGGTVLVDEPGPGQTRVSMTIAIRTGKPILRAPSISVIRNRDDGRVMLSNLLPTTVYEE